MNLDRSIREGYVKKVPVNSIRARSLMMSAKDAVSTACGMQPEEKKLKSIMRELYEGLREFCEAIGYLKGYKFLSHESMAYFIADVLKEPSMAGRFDRYRKIRNGINYYGNSVSAETVKEAMKEIPSMLEILEKHARK
jgi:hypothetical protein